MGRILSLIITLSWTWHDNRVVVWSTMIFCLLGSSVLPWTYLFRLHNRVLIRRGELAHHVNLASTQLRKFAFPWELVDGSLSHSCFRLFTRIAGSSIFLPASASGWWRLHRLINGVELCPWGCCLANWSHHIRCRHRHCCIIFAKYHRDIIYALSCLSPLRRNGHVNRIGSSRRLTDRCWSLKKAVVAVIALLSSLTSI